MAQWKGYDRKYALAHGPCSFKSSHSKKVLELLGGISGKEILEIGSNTGEFCNELRKKKAVPLGIDANAEAIKIAKKRFPGIDFFHSPIEEFSTKKRFDAAIMIDVIEHLHDTRAALKKIRSLLKPGGILLVSTGNGWDFLAKLICLLDGSLFLYDPTHVREFNPLSLRETMEKSGFSVKKMTSWPFPLVWRFFNNAGYWILGLNLIALAEKK